MLIELGRLAVSATSWRSPHVLVAGDVDAYRAGVLALAPQATTPGWWTSHADILADWLETYPGLEAAA